MLIGLPYSENKFIENHDKSKITKHIIFPICICQRETIYIFYKIDTMPRSAVGNMSGNRYKSDCKSRGREFDPFRGD